MTYDCEDDEVNLSLLMYRDWCRKTLSLSLLVSQVNVESRDWVHRREKFVVCISHVAVELWASHVVIKPCRF